MGRRWGVVVLVVALAGACASDDEPTVVPETTTTTEAETSTTTAVDGVEATIAELVEFVEEERGVTFVEPPDVELVGDDEFERRLLADLEGDREAIAKVEPRFRALGIIEPDTDLYEAFATLLEVGVVGFYDPDTGQLVVRGRELSVYGREIVVHELTHALDDQRFDIGDEVAPWSDDPGLAVLAAVEGSAELVRSAYADTLSADERKESTADQLALAGEDLKALLSLPRGLIELLGVPYQVGLTFAREVVDEEGLGALDGALTDEPPASMEQVLHPDAYLGEEAPVAVDPPPADGAVVEEGVLGEHHLRVMLELSARDTVPVAGWGGDRYVTWRDGARSCLRVAVVTDTERDRLELATAAKRWLDGGDSRDMEVGPDRLTLTGCV